MPSIPTLPRSLAALLTAAACLAAPARADEPALGYTPEHMDRRASPRQDFYRYAVGGWLARAEIPASEADFGGFSQLKAELDRRMLALVRDAAAASAPPGSPRQQIGDFWKAAMDTARQDALGLQPLQADLARIDEATRTAPSPQVLGEASGRLQQGFSVSPWLNVFATTDAKDSTRMLVVMIPGLQALERDEYLQPEGQRIRDLYVDFATRMFAAAGDSPEQAAAQARTVLAIETELVRGRLTPIEQRDPSKFYNVMTLAEAQALVPALDLKAHMGLIGAPEPATLQVMDLGGLKALQQVLATRTPAELRTVMRWHALSARASALGQPWRGLDEEFGRQRKGLASAPPRDQETVRMIAGQLYHPISQLYVEAYFPETTRAEITRIVGLVRDEFGRRLRSNPWLDESTRRAALDKLARIDIQIGAPKSWIDFSGVQIRPDDHYGNLRRLDEFGLRRELAKLGRPVVPERFAAPNQTTPVAVNAAYSPSTNSIDITAAIVQPPFYKPGADTAVNMCTIGAVVGHELTHGFDSLGRQFDATGNLRDWWTPQASAEFKKRTAVLVAQYGSYTLLPGLKHNGALTVTENTADLGGITLAYEALQRATGGRQLPRVDGLTTDQRCFVAWAQMWAYKARPERVRVLAATDYHANTALRGHAPLVHLAGFHKAFGTRPGDAMWRAPAQRVRIW